MGNTSVNNDAPAMYWSDTLQVGIRDALQHFQSFSAISNEHINNTPLRYVCALDELFAGCYKKPEDALSTVFTSNCDQMIHVKEIKFFSMCAHHLLPFFGLASFAYMPKGKIVGLSKIPRLVEVYARRPQVQEELTSQIVKSFSDIVKPSGCGLVIRAYHLCCMSRGIEQPTSYTETTELSGCFREHAVKEEFLRSVASTPNVWK